jgi:hypothetical protein
MEDIEDYISEAIQQGKGPNEVSDELNFLFGIEPSEGVNLYKKMKGVKSPFRERSEASRGSWREEYVDKLKSLLLLNTSFEKIAEYFGVDTYTLNTWKHEIPECREVWGSVLEEDFQVVNALLKLAKGWEEEDVKIGFCMGEAVFADYTKKIPPNIKAIETWLKTRYPKEWNNPASSPMQGLTEIDTMTTDELEEKLKSEYGISLPQSHLDKLEEVIDEDL